ncbi:MAG: hypothetical protein IPI14_10505 [Polaromonas sp.]|nr:hypothetical protein [Polaromonas sp.]
MVDYYTLATNGNEEVCIDSLDDLKRKIVEGVLISDSLRLRLSGQPSQYLTLQGIHSSQSGFDFMEIVMLFLK